MKKKKILIIGLGSIGSKHAKILNSLKNVSKIAILSNRKKIKFKKIIYIKSLIEFDPDYIIVSSITSKHISDLNNIEKYYNKKTVLIEKPLFEKNYKLNIKKNKYFVGYNLRYHPVVQFIKKIIKNKKIFSINLFCSSFLPDWRKNRDYTNTYSSKKKFGGGVLLELSHELDYLQWLFGKVTKIESATVDKISNLNINVEDRTIVSGKIKSISFILNLNFFSKINERTIIIDGKNFSLKGDLNKNFIEYVLHNKKKEIKFKNKKNFSYILQNQDFLKNNFKNLCSLYEGLNIIKLIEKIKKK